MPKKHRDIKFRSHINHPGSRPRSATFALLQISYEDNKLLFEDTYLDMTHARAHHVNAVRQSFSCVVVERQKGERPEMRSVVADVTALYSNLPQQQTQSSSVLVS